MHGIYRAQIEHLFARMWHWGIVRNIWRGSGTELHEYVHMLLHLQSFFIQRQIRYPPYGPWEHVPAHVWAAPTQKDDEEEDVVGHDGDVCALCCTKSDPEKMSMCDKCRLQYCTDCIDTHTCDNVTVLEFSRCVMLCTQVAHSDFLYLVDNRSERSTCVVERGHLGLMAFRILHDVLCGGKLACICLQLR